MTLARSIIAISPSSYGADLIANEIAALLAAGALRVARSRSITSPTTVNLPAPPESFRNRVDDPGDSWLHVQRVNTPESATGAGERT